MSVTTAQDYLAGIEEKYRTCLDTGLKIYEKSETLIRCLGLGRSAGRHHHCHQDHACQNHPDKGRAVGGNGFDVADWRR